MPAASTFPEGDFFEGQTFTGLQIAAASLEERELVNCTFANCSLQESKWAGTRLEDCTFKGCDLTRADFKRCSMRDVHFVGSKVMGVDFSKVSTHPQFSFEECHLRYALFEALSLKQLKVIRCTAREVNWLRVDLTDADFTGSDLNGSTIRGCTLTRTNFLNATGVFIDPAQNKISKTMINPETASALAAHLGFEVR